MITTSSYQKNYGYGYPDINYSGVSVVPGPYGLGAINLSGGLLVAALLIGTYIYYKKGGF
jgi:hypothetical protein